MQKRIVRSLFFFSSQQNKKYLLSVNARLSTKHVPVQDVTNETFCSKPINRFWISERKTICFFYPPYEAYEYIY